MLSRDIPGCYWVSRDTKYSRIGVFRRTCHLGASQDCTGYPGILSIQGLGCSGRHAIWGHTRMVLGILRYLVCKDWGDQADMLSGASQDGTELDHNTGYHILLGTF